MRSRLARVAAFALTLMLIGCASSDGPAVVGLPGRPNLVLSAFDLGSVGYTAEEFFISGRATSYRLAGEAGADGRWAVTPARTSPYVTRVVVVRPTDPRKFNGSVVVEWLNVSAGSDGAVAWNEMHRELIRDGFAYVGVSAQQAGVEGASAAGVADMPLKRIDPARYSRLSHPGDAFAYDIFSQAGELVRKADSNRILGPLSAKRVIAVGDAQSALFLTTYANAVDPLARVYDGILISSRIGIAAPLDGSPVYQRREGAPAAVRLRPDLRIPVMSVIPETDVVGGGRLASYEAARQPDTDRLRVWEIAGAPHIDNYMLRAGFGDSGRSAPETLATACAPSDQVLGARLAKPIDCALQHHYVLQAALWQLDRWVRTGQAPPHAAPIVMSGQTQGQPVRDVNGAAQGGVRTPWVDTPTARLSGTGNSGGPLGFLLGVAEPFDAETLDRLYPAGRADYLRHFTTSLDSAIKNGVVLPADRSEILKIASLGWRRAD
jgi:hypothetical protein